MRRILFTVFSLTLAVSVVLLWFGLELVRQFRHLEDDWQRYSQQAAVRSYSLSQLHRHFGYGGFIHQFKNLVLRQDAALYPLLQRKLEQSYGAIDDYMAVTGANQQAARQLREIVDHYAHKLRLIPVLIERRRGAEWLDSEVRVDDGQALRALQQLAAHELEARGLERQRMLRRIDDYLQLLYRGAIALPVIVLVGMWSTVLLLRLRGSRRLASRLTLVQEVLQMSPDAMLVSRADGCIEYGNTAASRLLGYPLAQLRGMNIDRLSPERFRQGDLAMREQLFSRDAVGSADHEMKALTADGEELAVGVSLQPLAVGEGSLVVSCLRDISMQRQRQQQLQHRADQYYALAHRDALTGVANRRFFEDCLAQACQGTQATGMPLSLLMIDVDQFKRYNDHYGHPAGDRCLVRVAGVLQRVVQRSGDVVARYGGEEFVCVLPGTGLDEAQAVAQRLLVEMAAEAIPHEFSAVKPYITFSVGICTARAGHCVEAERLLAQADCQLYQAKQSGRNGFKAAVM